MGSKLTIQLNTFSLKPSSGGIYPCDFLQKKEQFAWMFTICLQPIPLSQRGLGGFESTGSS
jgi:hypothetical protein